MSSPSTRSSTTLFLLALPILYYYTLTHPPPTSQTQPAAMWFQKQLTLPSAARGSYLVTDRITSQLPELKDYRVGLLNLFVQHTSCALSLNENWDEDVRHDMTDALERVAPYEGPKGEALYRHDAEGRDDMPVGTAPWIVVMMARRDY